jgi:hypothetical protein
MTSALDNAVPYRRNGMRQMLTGPATDCVLEDRTKLEEAFDI